MSTWISYTCFDKETNAKNSEKMRINPFSSNIHIQILQTELLKFP